MPKIIYIVCGLLAMAWWIILFSIRMDDFAKTLYVVFLPLVATPYIMWVIHREGQESQEYFKEMYAGNVWLMWFVRIFMMIVVSVLVSVAALLIFGLFGFIASLFK